MGLQSPELYSYSIYSTNLIDKSLNGNAFVEMCLLYFYLIKTHFTVDDPGVSMNVI